MYNVEKDIPVCKIKSGRPDNRGSKYPFASMEVGDSFLVGQEQMEIKRVISAASIWGKRLNMRFSVLNTEDGYRCWRRA